MKFACIGVSPKDVSLAYPMMDASSGLYFENVDESLRHLSKELMDIVFVDINIPRREKQKLAIQLYEINPNAVSLNINEKRDEVVLVKPVSKDQLEETLTILIPTGQTEKKSIYIRTFGRFVVFKDGKPCVLRGKAKEILALLVSRRGKEVSNEEIYTTIWENRPYSNRNMIVYYNALRRLKNSLKSQELEELLISAHNGQMVDTKMFDCDYYEWLEGKSSYETGFEEEFLSEYSWGEYILSDMISRIHN